MDETSTAQRIKEGLASGDASALDLLWDCYAGELFSYAQSLLCSKQDAEDAIHNLFLKIAKSRKAVAAAANLKPYLFRMMRNEAMDAIGRRSREIPSSSSLELLPEPEAEAVQESRPEELAKALEALPEEQRVVVILKIFKEMKFKDIAEALEISQDTAASRFRYALQKLRASLEIEP